MNETISLGRILADNHFFAVYCYYIPCHFVFLILFTAWTAAIAGDLSDVLLGRFAAVIAAKILVRPDRAIAYFMSAFTSICHDIYSFCHLNLLARGRWRGRGC